MLLKLELSHSKWFQDEYPQIIFAWKLENTLNDSEYHKCDLGFVSSCVTVPLIVRSSSEISLVKQPMVIKEASGRL